MGIPAAVNCSCRFPSAPKCPRVQSAPQSLFLLNCSQRGTSPRNVFLGGHIAMACVARPRAKATESPDPPWLPDSPDPPWPPKRSAPPWPPESPDPPWLRALEAGSPASCPPEASRAPTPLPVGWCTVRDTPFGRGE